MDFSEFKLEAVNAYLKYLQSRIDIIKGIIRDRDSRTGIQKASEENPTLMETGEAKKPFDSSATADSPGDAGEQFINTGRIDANEQAILPEFRKIPRGQTIILETGKIDRLPVKIASREFIIDVTGPGFILISRDGDRYTLRPGENLIGRSTKCSIVLNPKFDDISRQHLIIEHYPDNTLHFTDLSSSGTWLRINS